MMDKKTLKKLEEGIEAAETMFREFMEPSTNIEGQYAIYMAQKPKIKAARKALALIASQAA